MKRQKSRLLLITFIFVCILSATASAMNPRASDYLDQYEVDAISTGGGEVAIRIFVNGTGKMSCLGADEITIYEKINGRWMIADYFDRDDPGMVDTNTNTFTNTIYFAGYSDTEYKVSATVFAENSIGSDSRTQVVYVNT